MGSEFGCGHATEPEQNILRLLEGHNRRPCVVAEPEVGPGKIFDRGMHVFQLITVNNDAVSTRLIESRMREYFDIVDVNDTDAPPNARPLTNNDERAFLHPNPPTLTIRIPPRRLCSVCSRVYPILDKQIPTAAANALPGQTDDDDGNERYVGGVLNVAPSPTVETEHVRRGVHQILQRPQGEAKRCETEE
ncbi:hypothetical protein BGY98DRAFT_1100658 [Russula aff. rugulosa BPL654]|nr:hypothetical protein BGY98DRAFT_1100658 [Russula aff. rugulosa BPL654]